jgi:hypothetical protein
MSKDPAEAPVPRPYEAAAEQYWTAGWTGILPLPPQRKSPPAEGWTGWLGDWPSYADVLAWVEDRPRSNIGLRMPHGVLGIDVDSYGNKHGGYTRQQCELKWGLLPDTWRSTSRDDGVSGIYFFRVPPGLDWPGVLPGGDVETIHFGHRYAVAPPSLHPEGGRPYRWFDPHGIVSTGIPRVADLPLLPVEWIVGLGAHPHTQQARADLDDHGVTAFLTGLPGHDAACCPLMEQRSIAAARSVRDPEGSRHDKARDQVLALIRFAEQGHKGVDAALDKLRAAFIGSVTGDGSRTQREASAEWHRVLTGGVRIVAGNPELSLIEGDPCPPVLERIQLRPTVANRVPDLVDTVPPQVSPETDDTVANRVPDLVDTVGADLLALLGQQQAPIRERTTWWPASLAVKIQGQAQQEPPQFLRLTDNQACFYRGRVNGIIGASESGKTWLVLLACAQAIATNSVVLYLDFEDSARGINERMEALGCDPDDLTQRFFYARPDETLAGAGREDLQEAMDALHPDLIIVDGLNAAMSLMGLDLMSNKDVTTFSQLVLQPLTCDGATAVTYVDHVTKSDNPDSPAGGIGAQAKRASTTGCALKVTVTVPFGTGQRGELRVTVDKDRPGLVRGRCRMEGTVAVLGTAEVVSTGQPNTVTIRVVPARPAGERNGHMAARRFPAIMEAISVYLEGAPQPMSQNAIFHDVTGHQASKKTALDTLVAESYVQRATLAGGYRFTSGRPYREASEDPFGGGTNQTELPSVATVANRGQGVARPQSTARVHRVPSPSGDTVDRPRSDQDQIANRDHDLEPTADPPQRQQIYEHVTINDDGQFIDLDTGQVIDPDDLDRDV